LNSTEVQAKLSAKGSRAERFARDARPDPQKLDELFWAVFARPASEKEAGSALEHLAKHAADKKSAWEDIIWALVNAKEFQFIN
jgi:hypothetical protein